METLCGGSKLSFERPAEEKEVGGGGSGRGLDGLRGHWVKEYNTPNVLDKVNTLAGCNVL